MAAKPLSLPKDISRMLYLTDALRIPVPKSISQHIFMGDLITLISTKGFKAAITDLGIPDEQLRAALEVGAAAGPTDEAEFRMLVASQALEGLEDAREEAGLTKYLAMLGAVNDFAKASKSDMISFKRESMHAIEPEGDFPKWNSGFFPLDATTEGLYQGIILMLAKSGVGKTSTMLTIMESFAKLGYQSLWYISTEIPMRMMKYRIAPIVRRTDLPVGFEIMTGQLTPRQVLLMHMDEPDESRIIIHDSPDALGGGGDQRRFTLEDHYRDLVMLKEQCAAVLTVSQVRRKDKVLGMESVAESWAKAWYSDVIWTTSRTGFFPDGQARLHSSVVKNRFGPVDREISYKYDYVNLTYDSTDSRVSMMNGWDDELEEDDVISATRDQRGEKKQKTSRQPATQGEGNW